jgi:Pre-toxin TG
MPIVKQLRQYAGRRITRRLYRTMPWLGGALALVTLGSAMRRKGAVRGIVDTALDFVPVVGGVKNLVEIRRGRDLIPDKQLQ